MSDLHAFTVDLSRPHSLPGVRRQRSGRFGAQIEIRDSAGNRKSKWIGTFDTAAEAHAAYRAAAQLKADYK